MICTSCVRLAISYSNTLKRISMGYFRDARRCQWGRVAVVILAGDGCNISGWVG